MLIARRDQHFSCSPPSEKCIRRLSYWKKSCDSFSFFFNSHDKETLFNMAHIKTLRIIHVFKYFKYFMLSFYFGQTVWAISFLIILLVHFIVFFFFEYYLIFVITRYLFRLCILLFIIPKLKDNLRERLL